MNCLRNDPTCDCTPLTIGERVGFHCITHNEYVEGEVVAFLLGHTYTVRADCGIACVSTTQVDRLDAA